MSAPPPLLLPPPSLEGVEQVVAEPLRFKAKLAIGEDAYTSLRMINRTRELWDVLGAAGAGAAVAKTGMAASILGASATPIGWVALAALASGGACYGLYRLLGNTKGARVIEIPKYLNTPLDTLGLAIFDLIAPLSLRLAAVDGAVDEAERAFLVRHLVDEWGLSPAFVRQAIAAIEPRLGEGSIEAMAREGADFLHLNPDCNHAAIAQDTAVFLRAMLAAGGPITPPEEDALATVTRLLATAPPGEVSKAWAQARLYAGGAAGQVRTVIGEAADWTQERLPKAEQLRAGADQVRAGAGDAAQQALEAARKAADWTQRQLPSAEQVRTTATETADQALLAARKAAEWTQERLPTPEQLKTSTAEAASVAAGAAKKGLSWALDQAARAKTLAASEKLLRRKKPSAEGED
ncbi:TerB family tellurite resistance protein [Roseateles amylovorans]|uniref:TerB family tellurite resistance protein n=1 Tax=Roseateles amylovorans TaxID=2978473 RepID=A0ABY6AX65_9BURK|nr:TerB family tellurite resistance protein [Roseateles amylovorans]UXH77380.1 TerB family tellurite resistance protein [Roseateles amylovorans]